MLYFVSGALHDLFDLEKRGIRPTASTANSFQDKMGQTSNLLLFEPIQDTVAILIAAKIIRKSSNSKKWKRIICSGFNSIAYKEVPAFAGTS